MKDLLIEIISQIDLTNIIITVLGTIGAFVITKIKKLYEENVKKNIDKINNELLKSLAVQAVSYVEFKFSALKSEEKLEKAMTLVFEALKEKGINVTLLGVRIAIEVAVKAMRDSGTEVKSKKV